MVCENPNVNVVCSKVYAFFASRNSCSSLSIIKFRLKGNDKHKSLSKRVVQVVLCQLFKEICIKSKNIVSSHLSFRGNGMI